MVLSDFQLYTKVVSETSIPYEEDPTWKIWEKVVESTKKITTDPNGRGIFSRIASYKDGIYGMDTEKVLAATGLQKPWEKIKIGTVYMNSGNFFPIFISQVIDQCFNIGAIDADAELNASEVLEIDSETAMLSWLKESLPMSVAKRIVGFSTGIVHVGTNGTINWYYSNCTPGIKQYLRFSSPLRQEANSENTPEEK